MPLQRYDSNVGIVKDYGEEKYKCVVLKAIRSKDFVFENYVGKGSVNDKKLENNISRARTKIFDYARCNKWDYFFTGTLDGEKYNRYELQKFYKNFRDMVRNLSAKNNQKIEYLIIPEMHKDGAWHIHGFIKGILQNELRKFKLKEKLPTYIRQKLLKGETVFEWEKYRKKFGFCDLESIKNHEAAARYVLKYITKDLQKSISEIGAHLYYCSQGLKLPTEIKRGQVVEYLPCNYKNDYVRVTWIDGSQALTDCLSCFNNNNIAK